MLEILSRLQFAMTVAFHFIFVPVSIGLILFVAIYETKYLRTNNEQYRKLADYLGNIFIVFYAIGIVTGIAMSLQFGTNWGNYSKFMGNVFGPPLALEALIAFFLESTFTGIYIFRRNNISKLFRTLTTWIITFGTSISALWIITASGFMQHPVGYELAADGSHVILTDIFSVLLNPYAWYMLTHTVSSAILLGSFFVIGITSYKLLKKDNNIIDKQTYMKANKASAILALITSIIVPGIGFSYMNFVAEVQPTKMDAIAGGIPLVTISFVIMVVSGLIIPIISLLIIFFHKQYINSSKLLRVSKWIFIIPYLAIMSGWIVTEVGRQPWIVYGLLTTNDGISDVPIATVLFSLVTIILLYLATFILFIHILKVQIRKNLDDYPYNYLIEGGN